MKQLRIATRILIVLCICVEIIGFNLWIFFGNGFFYKAIAVHFICTYTLSFRLSLKPPPRDVFVVKGALIGVIGAFANLTDESFFNPRAIEINEYVFWAAMVLVAAIPFRWWKRLIHWQETLLNRIYGERTDTREGTGGLL